MTADTERAQRIVTGMEIARAEEHVDQLTHKVVADMKEKYMRGQREYGGDLMHRNLIRDVLSEAIDITVYAYSLEEQLADVVKRLRKVRSVVVGHPEVYDELDTIIRLLSKYAPQEE